MFAARCIGVSLAVFVLLYVSLSRPVARRICCSCCASSR
jgi:hypothetical protein